MKRKTLLVTAKMESYVAHPYWPERAQVIDIQKKSGMNRAQSDATRDRALKGYLEKNGMTLDDYRELVRLADRQWYRENGEASDIIVPRHQISGALVQTVKTAPTAVRGKYKEENLRHEIRLGDFKTSLKEPNAEPFTRYVKLETSNQRSLQSNEVIRDFEMVGEVEVDVDSNLKDLEKFLDYAFSQTGIGACRKMGYGRGMVTKVEVI